MTRKEYVQKWRAFMHKNAPLNKVKIWKFQKSILSEEEQFDANRFDLHLDKDDPRNEVMEISDIAYSKVPL